MLKNRILRWEIENNITDHKLARLIAKQKILVQDVGHKCIHKYHGVFFSIEVRSIIDNGNHYFMVSDNKYYTYKVNQMQEWSTLLDADNQKERKKLLLL